jgi:LysR family transcriptional regulator, low CO2-responsive transcriptional regulator
VVGRTGITYHQLQTFLAVARSGNLTKVARELNATQPTVSLQLRALRKSLGISLFERPGGRFRLTPAGEKLRRYAEEALDGLNTLQQEIAVLKGSLTGSLAVGVTFFVVSRVLPEPPRFRAQFPGVDIQLHVDLPEPLFNHLLTNTLDVACYLKVRTPPGLTVELLGEEEFAIIASPQHRLAGRRRISAKELSEEPFVVSSVSVFRELVEAKLRAVGVTPRVVAEARNYDAVNELVDRNVGYSMHLKPLVAADIAAGRFVPLRLDGPPILGEIVVAFRTRRAVPPLIEEFVRFMRAELERPRSGRGPETPTRDAPGGRAVGARRPRRRP